MSERRSQWEWSEGAGRSSRYGSGSVADSPGAPHKSRSSKAAHAYSNGNDLSDEVSEMEAKFSATKPLSRYLEPNLEEPQWPQKMMDQALQYRRELTDAQIEVKTLKKENTRLVQLLAKEIEKEERLLKDVEVFEDRMERLKLEQENKNKSWLEKMDAYQGMQNKVVEVETSNSKLKIEIQVLEDRIKVLESDNQDLRATLISVRGGMDLKSEQLAGEKERISELEAMVHDLRNEYRQKESTWKHIELEMNRGMQAVQIQANTHLAALNEERQHNMALRTELQAMARFREENAILLKQRQDVEKHRDQLDSELSTMRFQFEKLKMEILMAQSERAREMQALSQSLEEWKRKYQALEDSFKSKEHQNAELIRLCDNMKRDLDFLQREREEDKARREETKTARRAVLDHWEKDLKERSNRPNGASGPGSSKQPDSVGEAEYGSRTPGSGRYDSYRRWNTVKKEREARQPIYQRDSS